MASSQLRRVFVGNIPYDATEEQLIEIFREVGPVVSFRLVVDKETGKSKGFGFCEYKDEETALSARRNLQGYEINGRQLRVDFAGSDKNTDKSREQGRGGPGLAANVDPETQIDVPVNQGDFINNQPIGVHLAVTASMVMTGALGGPRAVVQSNKSDLQSQAALGYDPLTFHLAIMSRRQLTEILSELKMMATKDKELACKLLLSRPQLAKALFQVQIMLNMVTPQVLQMPNLLQPTCQLSSGQSSQHPEVQTAMGLPPSTLNKLASGMVSKSQEAVDSNLDQNNVVSNQFSAAIQPLVQLQQNPNHPALPPNTILEQSSSTLSSVNLQSLISMSGLQLQPGQGGAPSLQSIRANNIVYFPLLPHPPLSDVSFQLGPLISSDYPRVANKEWDRTPKVLEDANWVRRSNTLSEMPFGSTNKCNNQFPISSDPNNRASKLMKLGEGRCTSYSRGPPGVSLTSGLSQEYGFSTLPANATPTSVDSPYMQQQCFQTLLPPEVRVALLHQVLSLTPEQLSCLPLEQQQLIIQIQEKIRGDQIWPSQAY